MFGLLRPAPRSGAWPRPCRRRRRSVSARVQGHGRRAAKPLTGATIGCRSISRDSPFGWRRRLPPSPPKPRTGDEAGGAGSNRTSVPGRGHHTTALSWTQCQSFLDNIIAGFQPNLSLNDRRNDDRTPTHARIVSPTDSNGASANRSMYEGKPDRRWGEVHMKTWMRLRASRRERADCGPKRRAIALTNGRRHRPRFFSARCPMLSPVRPSDVAPKVLVVA